MKEYPAIAERYAHDCIAGTITACKRQVQACVRFLADLERSDIAFLPDMAAHACTFAEACPQSKGAYAGKPLILSPWQVFIYCNLFGFYYFSGRRRFRTGFVFVARKNGKSTMCAPIAAYALTADGEAGAEVYTVATKLDQARIVFDEARRMIRAGRDTLLASYQLMVLHREVRAPGGSVLKPLTSKHDTADGLNPHCVIADEVHAMNSEMLGVIDTAMGSRERGLFLQITTAGEPGGTGDQVRAYACKILDGSLQDDTFFASIFELDEEKEVNNPESWVKANPNLGVSVSRDYVAQQVERAGASELDRANVLTKHFNVFRSASVDFATVAAVDACQHALVMPKGAAVVASVDYCSSYDCATAAFSWFNDSGTLHTLQRHFIPRDTVEKQKEVPWQQWLHGGTLEIIKGAIVDPEDLVRWLTDTAPLLGARGCEVAFDKFQFNQASVLLQSAGFKPVGFGQKAMFFSEPTKTLARLIGQNKLSFADPVLRDMLLNVSLRADKSANVMPVKVARHRKIDGVVALVMALARLAELQRVTDLKARERDAKHKRINNILGLKHG